MKKLSGEEGAALVTALLLTLLTLVIATTLLYSVTLGTKIGASHKRYRNALHAAHGGLEVLTEELMPRLLQVSVAAPLTAQALNQIADRFPGTDLAFRVQAPCLTQKLFSPTAAWSSCQEGEKSPDAGRLPDVTFRLQGTDADVHFDVATKIVDTVRGNTVLGGCNLDPAGSVDSRQEIVTPEHAPYLYGVSVQGQSGDASEKAKLSVLYAY